MKILIAVGMLIVLFASPVLAKSKRVSADAQSAHAQQTGPGWQGDTMNGPNGTIMWGGRVKAQDPDPHIRMQMIRVIVGYGGGA